MKFFLDTADINEIKELAASGLVDGVTTNPSLVMKSGRKFLDVVKEICKIVPGPISAEVISTDHKTMLAEGRKLAKLAKNVVVKVPLTPDGLKTCKALSDEGTKVNVTLCFSPAQALLAAKAGAAFISPFIGRLDDIGVRGLDLIEQIRTVYDNYMFDTQLLAASIRSVEHVNECAIAGADCATIPPAIFRQLYKHELTDKGLAAFLKDWQASGQKIL